MKDNKRHILPSVSETDTYMIKAMIESDIHFANFEHDGLLMIENKGDQKSFKTSNTFEAQNSETLQRKSTEIRTRF